MDDLTMFNLVSLWCFFACYPYHNLIIIALGMFGPYGVALCVVLIILNLIGKKLAFNS